MHGRRNLSPPPKSLLMSRHPNQLFAKFMSALNLTNVLSASLAYSCARLTLWPADGVSFVTDMPTALVRLRFPDVGMLLSPNVISRIFLRFVVLAGPGLLCPILRLLVAYRQQRT